MREIKSKRSLAFINDRLSNVTDMLSGDAVMELKLCMIEAVVIAEQEAERLANNLNKKAFVLKSVSAAVNDEINLKVDSYEAALKYLGRSSMPILCSEFDEIGIHNKHVKALSAIYQLITIAEAWNKADEFAPDFSDRNQYKWSPRLAYNTDATGFVCAGAISTASAAIAYFGSRLCFKSKKRATQFGKQFIDLWSDFLLFR